LHKKLFEHKENKASEKSNQRQPAMMMFLVTMIKRVRTYAQGQKNHSDFKRKVINNIISKKRKTAQKQRQQGAMNSAEHRGADTDRIPTTIVFHKCKYIKRQQCCKKFIL